MTREFLALEVGIKGCRIMGITEFKGYSSARQQCRLERFGHRRGNLSLQCQDVLQIPIVGL
jgi:hypothetical protein